MTTSVRSTIWNRPAGGWSSSNLSDISVHLTESMSQLLGLPLEIAFGSDDRDAIQMFPDLLCFRVRSKPCGSVIFVGGIVSAKAEGAETVVDAILFLFVNGERVSKFGGRANLELEYQPNGDWITMWVDEEFEEYEDYTQAYFTSLVNTNA